MNPDICQPPDIPGLVGKLLADTDCQAFGLVQRGYAALADPGSSTSVALTAMMVIAVAFFGYRLMLGRGLALSSLTGLVVRLGIVLLLAASWGAWQEAAYDTLARAPTRVAQDLIAAIDAPAPLQGIQEAIDKIEQASIGWRQRAGIASPFVGGPPSTAMALTVSSFLLTMTTVGSLVVSRIILALLLAITPVMAGFLLFDATRGLLEGWLRAMIAAALVPIGVLVLAAVELAIITPILDQILAEQAGGRFLEDSVTPLGLVSIVFAIALIASFFALSGIARGVRLARTRDVPGARDAALETATNPALTAQIRNAEQREAAHPAVVRALESAARREPLSAGGGGGRAPVIAALRSSGSGQSDAGRSQPGALREINAPMRMAVPGRERLRRSSRAAKRRDS